MHGTATHAAIGENTELTTEKDKLLLAISSIEMHEILNQAQFANMFKCFKSTLCKFKIAVMPELIPILDSLQQAWRVLFRIKPCVGVDARGGLEVALAKSMQGLRTKCEVSIVGRICYGQSKLSVESDDSLQTRSA